jgi:general secretion pathway protein D
MQARRGCSQHRGQTAHRGVKVFSCGFPTVRIFLPGRPDYPKFAALLLVFWIAWPIEVVAFGQDGQYGNGGPLYLPERIEYQAYPLRYRSPVELEGTLRSILGDLPGVRVLTDPSRREILISAPPQFQGLIGQLITRLDQPPTATLPQPAAQGGLEVRSYRCPGPNLENVAEYIRAVFRAEPNLRVAADPGTSRLFVVATPQLHAQIEKMLSNFGGTPDPSFPSGPATSNPSQGLTPGSLQPELLSSTPGIVAGPAENPLRGQELWPLSGGMPQISGGNPPTPPPAASGSQRETEPIVTALLPRSRPTAGSTLHPADSSELDTLFVEVPRENLRQVREQLGLLLGAKLEPLATPQPGRAEVRFQDLRGRWLQLGFDPTNGGIWIQGHPILARQMAALVRALSAESGPESTCRVLPLGRVDPEKVRQAVEAYRAKEGYPGRKEGSGGQPSAHPGDGATSLWDARGGKGLMEQITPLLGVSGTEVPGGFSGGPARRESVGPPADSVMPASFLAAQVGGEAATPGEAPGQVPGQPPTEGQPAQPLLPAIRGDVDVETLPDLDVIILRGRQRDVEELSRIIAELERLSAITEPKIEVYRLRHVNCMALTRLILEVQTDLVGTRQGRVRITPLVKPNALLLIGWGEALEVIKQLIEKLDQPVSPQTELRIFPLKRANANAARTTIAGAFVARGGLSPEVQVVADIPTNSLIVRAAPNDMREVELLIRQLESESQAVLQTRLFKLRFTLATDLAGTLQSAISAAVGGFQRKSAVLELVGVDREKHEIIRSGLLTDVQIVPDPHTNTLVVTAPPESMELVAALIAELDVPTAVAQIKVFRVFNADATALANLLRTLFPPQPAGAQLAGAEGETTLVPLRFSVDVRTNSIIATGSRGDLAIVEALLLRLDEEEVRQRVNTVYRLKNAPAVDVARSINDFLRSERQLQLAAPGVLSPFQQIEAEVVVVPEPVSNALIISATPRFFPDIMELVEKLDELPPQVIIQALIVEVELGRLEEFGAEFGLQDSVLFDRSVVTAASITPGFNFNNAPLGNSGSAASLATKDNIGTQGLTHFSLGRMNTELGYGGLVFAASSQNLSILLRALQDRRQLRVLARPQIMTLDNQPAFIQVGKRVPRIIGTRFYAGTQFNAVELEPVGLILSVTPRISPDGTVVMQVDAEKSELGPESEGIPVSISGGEVIRSPSVNVTTAQTTVSAGDGETIVIGGLITKYNTFGSRRIPYLADIPLIGRLFRMDLARERRSELLIILTPRVVRNPEDAERIKQQETARINWVLSDVLEIHGPIGIPGENSVMQGDDGVPVIFPALTPCWSLRSRKCPPSGARPIELQVPQIVPSTPESGKPEPTIAPQQELSPHIPNPGVMPQGT